MVIEPQLCMFSDFYFRVFIKVRHSPKDCVKLYEKISMVASCVNCQYYHLQNIAAHIDIPMHKCPICSSSLKLVGPIWNGEIHNLEFIKTLISELPKYELKTSKKIIGMLSMIKEEIEMKVPPLGYYTHFMISEIKSNAPNLHSIMYFILIMYPKKKWSKFIGICSYSKCDGTEMLENNGAMCDFL